MASSFCTDSIGFEAADMKTDQEASVFRRRPDCTVDVTLSFGIVFVSSLTILNMCSEKCRQPNFMLNKEMN